MSKDIKFYSYRGYRIQYKRDWGNGKNCCVVDGKTFVCHTAELAYEYAKKYVDKLIDTANQIGGLEL